MMQKHFVIEQLIMNGKSLVISRMMLSNANLLSLIDTFTNDSMNVKWISLFLLWICLTFKLVKMFSIFIRLVHSPRHQSGI